VEKIAFIGAGSFEFTRDLVRDLLTYPRLRRVTLSLMDIDPERLEFSRRAVVHLVEAFGADARVEATLHRQQALEGADVVLTTILVGAAPRASSGSCVPCPSCWTSCRTWNACVPGLCSSTTPIPWPCWWARSAA